MKFDRLTIDKIKNSMAGILIWLLVIAILIMVAKNYHKTQLGIIDTQAIVTKAALSMAQQYPKGQVPADMLKPIADKLKRQVEAYAAQRNIVLLAKPAVWGGELIDYTEDFISEKMINSVLEEDNHE